MTRFIYADESGQEDTAPRTVVAGLIVDADKQLVALEAALEEVLRGIPPHLAEAVDKVSIKGIWGDERWRDGWSVSNRIRFIKNVLSLPRKLQVPISYSVVIRGSYKEGFEGAKKPLSFLEHGVAITHMAARADKWIREHGHPSEIAMLIYEDMGDNNAPIFEAMMNVYRNKPLHLRPEHTVLTEKERELGYSTQETEQRVERIRKRILFQKQEAEPLILLADAAAWTLRRYFNEEEMADDFAEALLGKLPNRNDWIEGGSTTAYQTPKKER